MRVACVVEYDGAGFRGWQVQEAGVRTVQAVVERALARVADAPVDTVCAGRTDSGVHATGQVIHFDTTAIRPDKAWVMGTNDHLPPDVAIRGALAVPDAFHARYGAVARSYRYVIVEGWNRPALWRARAAWSRRTLDAAAMQAGARWLVGEHDFTSFRTAACQARHPVRTVHALEVARTGGTITIDIRANAFLHNMVRIIAGVLMTVGRGERPPEWVGEVLARRDRTRGGVTAPPQGLYFLGPTYPPDFGVPAPVPLGRPGPEGGA